MIRNVGGGSNYVGNRVTCRLCMRDHDYYLSIFISHETCSISLGPAIQDLLSLEVTEGDGLPDTICRNCVQKLIEFCAFKQLSVKSATELRRRAVSWRLKNHAADIRPSRSEAYSQAVTEEVFPEKTFFEGGASRIEADSLELGYQCRIKVEEESIEAVPKGSGGSRENIAEAGLPTTAVYVPASYELAEGNVCPVKEEPEEFEDEGDGSWRERMIGDESRSTLVKEEAEDLSDEDDGSWQENMMDNDSHSTMSSNIATDPLAVENVADRNQYYFSAKDEMESEAAYIRSEGPVISREPTTSSVGKQMDCSFDAGSAPRECGPLTRAFTVERSGSSANLPQRNPVSACYTEGSARVNDSNLYRTKENRYVGQGEVFEPIPHSAGGVSQFSEKSGLNYEVRHTASHGREHDLVDSSKRQPINGSDVLTPKTYYYIGAPCEIEIGNTEAGSVDDLLEELNHAANDSERGNICQKYGALFQQKQDFPVILYPGYNTTIGRNAKALILRRCEGKPAQMQRQLLLHIKGKDYIRTHSATGQRAGRKDGNPAADPDLLKAVSMFVHHHCKGMTIPRINKVFNSLAGNLRMNFGRMVHGKYNYQEQRIKKRKQRNSQMNNE